jgi:hypothetical protein
MGRELKRVPLDFQWPQNKVWSGYLNPHHTAISCPHCDGTGSSPLARGLKDKWYGYVEFRPEDRGSKPFQPDHPVIRARAERNARPDPECRWAGCDVDREARRLADLFNGQWSHHLNDDDVAALVARGRLMDLTHTWTQGEGWKAKEPAYIPTAAEVNDWSIRGMGHDAINQWIVTEAECLRLGIETACEHCGGEGGMWPSEEARKLYDDWTRTEPPSGEGYQIWETVSEGSPISPVFATPEALATHMAGTKWGADKGTPYATWLNFINGPGWAVSGVMQDGVMKSGVEAVASVQSPA